MGCFDSGFELTWPGSDNFGNTLLVGGAQSSGFGYSLKLSGTDLSDGDTITVSSDKALFRVPSGNWAVQVQRSGTGGADCWANYTKQLRLFEIILVRSGGHIGWGPNTRHRKCLKSAKTSPISGSGLLQEGNWWTSFVVSGECQLFDPDFG